MKESVGKKVNEAGKSGGMPELKACRSSRHVVWGRGEGGAFHFIFNVWP